MNSLGAERIVRIAAMLTAVLAGIGALLVGGYLEITFLMVAAVIAALICFDTAMERKLWSFAPWGLLSLAPIMKTIPTVWVELRSDSGLLVERYDHGGSLLFGACVFAAVAMLALPAERLGSSTRLFVSAAIAGSAVTGALAGASVAFLFDGGFGSAAAGRLIETSTWFVLSGMLAAAAIAASQARTLSLALTGVLATSCGTAGLLAVSVAGRDVDAGWWALLFSGLAVSAAGTDGSFGEQASRDRRSNVAVVVTLVVGLIAAASAIAARSDRTAWTPGWALLGLMSLAMFALAMGSKPVDEQTPRRAKGSRDGNTIDSDGATPTPTMQPQDLDPGTDAALSPEQSIEEFADQLDPPRSRRSSRGPASVLVEAAAQVSASPATSLLADGVDSAPLSPSDDPDPAVLEHAQADVAHDQPMPPAPRHPMPAAPRVGLADDNAQRLPRPAVQLPDDPQTRMPPVERPSTPVQQSVLSDATTVASVQAAAAVRNAPQTQRHSLAPLAQAHHFDPSTGLLSSAGLQHALARAFDVPRRAGHVTMLMFMIRDLDRIEHDHGRLASAAVTREVADRIGALLPQGTGARFARSAYAVVFVGDLSNVTETTQWLARVLLQLRAPVEGGSLGDKIDVVAGMAQCYESEDAAQFVKRANLGLARAAQLAEATLVAMP